ncbi:MAG: PEP-utilizing enzyme [Patescibacteria group bacterium]
MTKSNSKIEWEIISKKGVNFENLLMSIVARGMKEGFKHRYKKFALFGTKYYRQIDTHRDYKKQEVDDFIKRAKRVEQAKPGSILKSYLASQRILMRFKKLGHKLPQENLEKLNNKQLLTFFNLLSLCGGRSIWYAYNYYLFQYFSDQLYALLATKIRDIKKQADIFSILAQANKISLMQQEQIALLRLVVDIRSNSLYVKTKAVQVKIQQHIKQYGYMGFFYFRGRTWTNVDVEKRIISWFKKDYLAEVKKLHKLLRHYNEWKKLARTLGLTKDEILLIKTIKYMAYCTNLFDEIWNYMGYSAKPLLNEVAKRLNITYKQLVEMDTVEIIDYLNKGKAIESGFKKILTLRLKDSAFLMIDGKVSILVGKKLQEYRKQENQGVIKKVKSNIIKGQCASAGKAQGRAVLVRGVSDLTKVKKGNIMVAKSTVPSFVPAMEKAAAIITEMGGLLSHAAIVSRELNTPCVVGIESVMDMFKDGDLVEVDATKGLVKKL